MSGEGRLGVPGQVWEFTFLLPFPSFISWGKSQFKKCLGKRLGLEVPDILLPDIRGILAFSDSSCAQDGVTSDPLLGSALF